MTREDHARTLAAVLEAAADKAAASEAVTALSEDYAAMLANAAVLEAKVADLAKQNAALVEQNMKLFLKVGAVPPPAEDEGTGEEPKRTYEDLYKQLGIEAPG